MKLLATILLMTIIGSCVTQQKVNTWLRDHPTKAAGYCADNFPPDTTTRTIINTVDTGAYEAAYQNMERYSDSLFMELKHRRESFIPTPQRPCPPLVNLDSLRKSIDAELRKRLAPCKDSIQKVVYTIVDKAREKQLQGTLDEKDATISARDKTISEKDNAIGRLKKWPWLFWLLVVLIGGYAFLKLRYKLPF